MKNKHLQTEKNLEEKQISTEQVFDGVLLHVKKDKVSLPNGRESTREYIEHPGAVVIIALLPENRIVLERQYRYPSKQVFIELPAGKIDPGESIEETGRRELLEETGYAAKEMDYVGKLHPGIGYSNEVIYIYCATNLEKKSRKLDEDEFLEVFDLPLEEAYQMLLDGHITDAKSVIGIFWAQHHLAK